MSGWVKLYRGVRRHPALQTMVQRFLWEEILLRAAHKQTKVNWKGQTIGLFAGQLALSVRAICREFDIPHKAARCALDRFERDQLIQQSPIWGTVRGTGKGTVGIIVTVCNWEKYQSYEESHGTVEGTVGTHQGHSRGTQNKNLKNLEEERILKEGAPNGAVRDLDAELFRLGRELLGPKGGSTVQKAKKALKLGGACELFQTARTKDNPAEYIYAALRNAAKVGTPEWA